MALSVAEPYRPFILALDIGVESIGWAVLECEGEDQSDPTGIRRAGVHLFQAAIEGDFESGRDEPKAAVRRQKRQSRRQFERRARRNRKVFRLLQRSGLLPGEPIGRLAEADGVLKELDAALRARWTTAGEHRSQQVMVYRLRAAALDQPLEPFELGRALYHLAQRRGFKSGRKTQAREDEKESGAVKAGISELRAQIAATGKRTLGEYFASLDPDLVRIRSRWTPRDLYEAEFIAIIDAQRQSHASVLTQDFIASLSNAIFFQRPLKSQAHLIGRCSLIPGARRAPVAHRDAQRFRVLQKVNDLRVVDQEGRERDLAPAEREIVIGAFEKTADVKLATLRGRKYLKLPEGSALNLEAGEETKLPGMRTDLKLAEAIGPRWSAMDDRERGRVVGVLLREDDYAEASKALQHHAGLSAAESERAAAIALEPGYLGVSLEAVRRLLPHLESGIRYATARKAVFPDSLQSGQPQPLLPAVVYWQRDLRNPAVIRVLTELRKLVNAVVRRWGKPHLVRIELARDLKRSKEQRKVLTRRMRTREAMRDDARAAFRGEGSAGGTGDDATQFQALRDLAIGNPSQADIEKLLLAIECRWQCPYTGRRISAAGLFGRNPEFDVEHILPFSRSLDDSYANKTLCYHEENRSRKRNRTPVEAYGGNQQTWGEILQRVHAFGGEHAAEKLRRFRLAEIPADFTSRQLNDTRYASRLAADYVALLYGGRADESHKLRVQVSTGGATAFLRGEWQLNGILSKGSEFKSRDDHRHHAVDAITIGFVGPRWVKALSDAAEEAVRTGRRRFGAVPSPWPDFVGTVRSAVESIYVSRRAEHRVRGALHEESNLGRERKERDGTCERTFRPFRKPVESLSISEVERIIDPAVRAAVKEALERSGASVPAKAFVNDASKPRLRTKDGRTIPIRRVRIAKSDKPVAVGRGERERFVVPGANHHVAIMAVVHATSGKVIRWEGQAVSLLEATKRVARGASPFNIDGHDHTQFIALLHPGDQIILRQSPFGTEGPFTVRSISGDLVEFALSTDARPKKDIARAREWQGRRANGLRTMGLTRVEVSILGDLHPCRLPDESST